MQLFEANLVFVRRSCQGGDFPQAINNYVNGGGGGGGGRTA